MMEDEDVRLVVVREPDYRFTLANERTFLACMRTTLAMVAGGLATDQLVSEEGPGRARTVLSLLLIVLGMGMALASYRRYVKADEAIRNDAPLPPWNASLVLGAGVTVACGIAALIVLSSH
jgi:putative membrane protein